MSGDRTLSGLIDELLATTAGRLEDVAREAGVSYSALYSWATGRRRPSPKNRERLADLASERAARLERLADRLRRRGRSGDPGPAGSEGPTGSQGTDAADAADG